MNKYLPSKQFVKFFSAVILLALVIFAISKIVGDKEVYEREDDLKALNSSKEEASFYTLDSDGDGIYDWEEALWGTNPSSKDSDDDGVSDGEEVAARKKEIRKNNELQGDVGDENLNQTDVFARQFFSTVVSAAQGGGLDQGDLQDFSQSIQTVIQNSSIPDEFTLLDLKLSNVDKDSYREELKKILEPLATRQTNEEYILFLVAQGNHEKVVELEDSIKLYSDISNALLNMKVPHAVAGAHLGMVNSTAKIGISLISMNDIVDNPIQALVGINQYYRYIQEFEKHIRSLETFLR